jgi:DNA-binding XRE family transcriptional regulator
MFLNPIKTARLNANLSQTEMAKLLGVKPSSIHGIENGNVSIEKIEEICQKMGWNFICKIRVGAKSTFVNTEKK